MKAVRLNRDDGGPNVKISFSLRMLRRVRNMSTSTIASAKTKPISDTSLSSRKSFTLPIRPAIIPISDARGIDVVFELIPCDADDFEAESALVV